MRPGEAMENASWHPLVPDFFNHFTQHAESRQYNNSVNCCMYYSHDGSCLSSAWESSNSSRSESWDGMEGFSRVPPPYNIGMLLDLDEGTLSVYNSGRKFGVMKRGLAGHYCWVVALSEIQVTIKRGTVPLS